MMALVGALLLGAALVGAGVLVLFALGDLTVRLLGWDDEGYKEERALLGPAIGLGALGVLAICWLIGATVLGHLS